MDEGFEWLRMTGSMSSTFHPPGCQAPKSKLMPRDSILVAQTAPKPENFSLREPFAWLPHAATHTMCSFLTVTSTFIGGKTPFLARGAQILACAAIWGGGSGTIMGAVTLWGVNPPGQNAIQGGTRAIIKPGRLRVRTMHAHDVISACSQ